MVASGSMTYERTDETKEGSDELVLGDVPRH